MYIATVTGALCNCLPSEGVDLVNCQNYRLRSGSNVINVDQTARAQCSAERGLNTDPIHECLQLASESNGLVLPNEGIHAFMQ